MYKSPIDIIYGQLETQLEGHIMKAVQNVHVNVDKEELVRALRYDRDQYEHGFLDGVITAQQWIPVTERLPKLESYVYTVDVMFRTHDGDFFIGYANLETGTWKCKHTRRWFAADAVTHWMPMPEPPKGE